MPPISYHCRPATDEETAFTAGSLRTHTEASIGARVEHAPFAVTAYEEGELIGSVIGKIYSGWLHLELVWVAERKRGNGIGRTLIKNAIADANQRGLTGIEVWTQSWQSPEFYLHVGFTAFAVLEDFIPGQKRHAFRYLLKAAA